MVAILFALWLYVPLHAAIGSTLADTPTEQKQPSHGPESDPR